MSRTNNPSLPWSLDVDRRSSAISLLPLLMRASRRRSRLCVWDCPCKKRHVVFFRAFSSGWNFVRRFATLDEHKRIIYQADMKGSIKVRIKIVRAMSYVVTICTWMRSALSSLSHQPGQGRGPNSPNADGRHVPGPPSFGHGRDGRLF